MKFVFGSAILLGVVAQVAPADPMLLWMQANAGRLAILTVFGTVAAFIVTTLTAPELGFRKLVSHTSAGTLFSVSSNLVVCESFGAVNSPGTAVICVLVGSVAGPNLLIVSADVVRTWKEDGSLAKAIRAVAGHVWGRFFGTPPASVKESSPVTNVVTQVEVKP